MDNRSDGLSSPRTIGSVSSADSSIQGDQDSHKRWEWPIVTCVKAFKGGGLIVNSAPFRDALAEAERIWVEENIDYKVDEDVQGNKQGNGYIKEDDKDEIVEMRQKDQHVRRLEMDLQRLSVENMELRQIAEDDDRKNQPPIGPEQITKMYSDIYNNEWGEAFLYLTRKKKVKEVEAIEELLKIAESIFEFCDKTSREQMSRMTEMACIPCDDRGMLRKIHVPDISALPDDVIDNIHSCRNMASVYSTQVIEQLYFQNYDRSISKLPKNENIRQFITKCLHCFWLMRLQNPPMHMSFKIKRGSPFYPDVVMNYGKPGPEIDYLVWPAVMLHERGHVVLKGIVQCLPVK